MSNILKRNWMGFKNLFDDKNDNAGVKFSRMDLIGLPHQIIIGSKAVSDGLVEYKNRKSGETDLIINKKIQSALKENLKVIFCIGENLSDKKGKNTYKILRKQLNNGLKGIRKFNNIIVAYEPVWSIGSGIIPRSSELNLNINNIKKILSKLKKSTNINILYGGSVNPKNVKELAKIKQLNGFLIGGASLSAKKFIDIIKKTIN